MIKNVLIGTDLLISYLRNRDYSEGIAIVFRWIQLIGARRVVDMGSLFIATHFVSDEEAKTLMRDCQAFFLKILLLPRI